ncbi:hypothetical protein PPK14_gp71 [Bacillus phage vB_BspS_SplendidRed]|uniref:Uncharacterized protein n=1 Tax=Bacillus phage vB_BspS_SplendidRed TaxID=2591379 RepID=A0A5B9NKX7_9CAUD|nr:hypothetical protein PPK14_gp71 [Bacillus phage vB_BspS_SplendidRed]QEG13545.1 hypothetical protein SPLENDIDRED_71 [Bacillus phage vB_BspS_SplendidRed]
MYSGVEFSRTGVRKMARNQTKKGK